MERLPNPTEDIELKVRAKPNAKKYEQEVYKAVTRSYQYWKYGSTNHNLTLQDSKDINKLTERNMRLIKLKTFSPKRKIKELKQNISDFIEALLFVAAGG